MKIVENQTTPMQAIAIEEIVAAMLLPQPQQLTALIVETGLSVFKMIAKAKGVQLVLPHNHQVARLQALVVVATTLARVNMVMIFKNAMMKVAVMKPQQ
jgi:hypothetical protein